MEKMYQKNWQGIEFEEFAKTSSSQIAGPEFYQLFYDEFFRRYSGWEQLTDSWREEKQRFADLVMSHCVPGGKVLAVGCGLGAIEHYLKLKAPELDLYVHEVAPSAWQWIGKEFSDDRKITGLLPECLPKDTEFDLIYLSAVDYAFEEENLIEFLSSLRGSIKGSGEGRCLIIPGMVQNDDNGSNFILYLKKFVKRLLELTRIRSPGQFWGWVRSRDEFCKIMERAGFQDVYDAFSIHKDTDYWIVGKN